MIAAENASGDRHSLVVVLVAFVFGVTVAMGIRAFHKIHRLPAGVVLMAMLVPFFGMAWRYMHIYRCHGYSLSGWGNDDNRLRVQDWWRRACANIYSTINARFNFPANSDRHIRR